MEKLEQILKNYDSKRAELLYNECVELMELVSDEELIKIYEEHSDVFKNVIDKSKAEIIPQYQVMRSVKKILVEFIRSRHLSQDEFDAMTLDDVKDYLSKIITNKTQSLYSLIKVFENASRS